MSRGGSLAKRMHWRRWKPLRAAILERDGYRCVKCGKAGRLEVDHIEPVESGGTDDPANLQTLCRDCHILKTRLENIPDRERRDWEAYWHARHR